MTEEVLIEISLIIGIAAITSIIARAIKQPPIIAYLISGILVSPLVFGIIKSDSLIQIFAHLGVALLLFIVGLSLDYRVLKDIGGVAVFSGIGEIIVTGIIGFFIAIGLGLSYTPALYLAAALAFSSTIVVVKILSDKKETDTLHGRIAIGILIVEDFIAALVLMILPVIETGTYATILAELGKIALLIIAILAISALSFKKLTHYLAKSQEVLFLFGIGWALTIAALFNYLGFSLEIGALIAGMSLASTKYTIELSSKIKPLRDFFIVLFFVFFGSQLTTISNPELIKQAVIFSVFILIGKPIIIMSFMKIAGYKKRTNFLTGASIAQISEFSLILILLGFTLGHISQDLMSLAILIALITIGISSYSIYYAHGLFDKLSGILSIFDGHKYNKEIKIVSNYDIIVFGGHRIGSMVVNTLKKMKLRFIVIDYNPKVILDLTKKGVDCVYGDASDKELIEDLKLDKAKLVISTIPELDANTLIKYRLNEANSKAIFIATADYLNEAVDLYENGADYVIIPHLLGGEYASKMLEQNKTNPEKYKKEREGHISQLKKLFLY